MPTKHSDFCSNELCHLAAAKSFLTHGIAEPLDTVWRLLQEELLRSGSTPTQAATDEAGEASNEGER